MRPDVGMKSCPFLHKLSVFTLKVTITKKPEKLSNNLASLKKIAAKIFQKVLNLVTLHGCLTREICPFMLIAFQETDVNIGFSH